MEAHDREATNTARRNEATHKSTEGTEKIASSAQRDTRGYEGFAGEAREVASESSPAWTPERRPPRGSPNVIVMLLDDLGFSDIGPFGGEIETPNLDTLAGSGYRLTNYQTAPLCSPARAALLTGLNPHRAGFGTVVHGDPGYPGHVYEIADDAPTVAESFQAAGYATLMVGKWHLTKESKMNDGAEKSSWPLQRGFDRYYGCMDGFTSSFQPHRLVRDNSALTIDEYPDDFFLTDRLTDEAIDMVTSLRAADLDRPFFLYFAHQAVHAPLQAKPEDIEKYKGRYEDGWDHVRDERFAQQIRDGLFSDGTVLPSDEEPTHASVTPWEELTTDQRLLFARYMEVYAAAIDNVDQNLGRLIDRLKALGEYEDTVIVVTSDNGGSGEGGPDGTRSYFSQFAKLPNFPVDWERDVERDLHLIGGPRTFVHYPRGWAHASNTPFRRFKNETFAGGIRAPLVLSWPRGLRRSTEDDGVRNQFAYVSDLGQTMLALSGVAPLKERGGLPAKEVDGVSFDHFLRDPKQPTQHTTQYWETAGKRAYIEGDWKIIADHVPGAPISEDDWQLFDVGSDPTETRDLAEQNIEIVAELAERWRSTAWLNTVFPLDDDGSMRWTKPSSELRFEEPVTLLAGTPTLERFRSSKLTRLRSFEVEVDFDYRVGDAGVLVSHGDQGGGYVVFIEDGALRVSYNEYGRMLHLHTPLTKEGSQILVIRFTAVPDVKWEVAVLLDGTEVAALEPVLQFLGLCPFTGINVGIDRGSPVDWDVYARHRSFRYQGELRSVRYVPGPKAEYNPETIVALENGINLIYD